MTSLTAQSEPTQAEIRDALLANVVELLGRDPDTATKRDWFYALAYYLRGRLSAARVETWRRNFEHGAKWTIICRWSFCPASSCAPA